MPGLVYWDSIVRFADAHIPWSLMRFVPSARRSDSDNPFIEVQVVDPPLADSSRTGQIIVIRDGGNWSWVCAKTGRRSYNYAGLKSLIDCIADYRHSSHEEPTASHHGTLVDVDGLTDEELLIIDAYWFTQGRGSWGR